MEELIRAWAGGMDRLDYSWQAWLDGDMGGIGISVLIGFIIWRAAVWWGNSQPKDDNLD